VDPVTKDIVRYLIVILAAPIWVPFVRTLWRDFNAALRREGGLLGRAPSALELQRLDAQGRPETSRLVSEPIVRPKDQRKSKLGVRRATKSAPIAAPAVVKPRGFKK
jgi:hypothetical protein